MRDMALKLFRYFYQLLEKRLGRYFQVRSDSVIHSDDEGDIELLNSSQDPIKSSKLIVFWSCLVTLFNFCFQCPRKAHISKLRTQGSTVLVNITSAVLVNMTSTVLDDITYFLEGGFTFQWFGLRF